MLWATSNNALRDIGQVTLKTRTFNIPFSVVSLLPNSKYTFYCNNVDMSWAVKQNGKKLGYVLISDSKGNLSFTFLYENKYNTGYYLNTNKADYRAINNVLTCELRDISGNSIFYYIPINLRASL